MGDHTMAMTTKERSRVLRERRAGGKVVLTIVVAEDELVEIARAGYAEAASADRKGREAASAKCLSCGQPEPRQNLPEGRTGRQVFVPYW